MRTPTVFFDRTYDETMALLVETRNYVAYQERKDLGRLPEGIRLTACCESLRITSRLAHVMAWLLAQRAVHAGEMSLEQAVGDDFALPPGPANPGDGVPPDVLPAALRSLLDRSRSLYARVDRLSGQIRQTIG